MILANHKSVLEQSFMCKIFWRYFLFPTYGRNHSRRATHRNFLISVLIDISQYCARSYHDGEICHQRLAEISCVQLLSWRGGFGMLTRKSSSTSSTESAIFPISYSVYRTWTTYESVSLTMLIKNSTSLKMRFWIYLIQGSTWALTQTPLTHVPSQKAQPRPITAKPTSTLNPSAPVSRVPNATRRVTMSLQFWLDAQTSYRTNIHRTPPRLNTMQQRWYDESPYLSSRPRGIFWVEW